MLVGFEQQRAEDLLSTSSVRVVTGIDAGAAERLVRTLGRQQTNGRVVPVATQSSGSTTSVGTIRNGVLSGAAAAAAASMFTNLTMMLIIGVTSGLGAAWVSRRSVPDIELLDGTPRAVPDLPRDLRRVPSAIAAYMSDAPESVAEALEQVERLAFHIIGRLSDPRDLLNVLGGFESDLGQAATALATSALEAAIAGKNEALIQAAANASGFRSDLIQAEQLADGAAISASLDMLTVSIRNTVATLE